MSDESQSKSMSLAAMPGILVVLTIGYLGVVHAAKFIAEGTLWRPPGGLERVYREAGAGPVGEPVNRLRGRLGLEANQVVQRNGELYFLPDIAHVTGRSFLEQADRKSHVVLNREGREARESDPLPAILAFERSLRERGIRLVLLPTPSKAMFAGPGAEPLQNEGFAEFLAEMERHAIPVFDLAAHFAKYAERGNRLFLKSDSHWTPQTMRMSAVLLAAFLKQEGFLSEIPEEEFLVTSEEVSNRGDLALLLEGGRREDWWETITVHPLRGRDGSPWQPDRESPVLLLGDSFSNVFSVPEMGWGEDAGFAEALSQALEFSVDRIARNADGAFASRQELSGAGGRLEAKTVVVWQFAARELSFGDWKNLPLPEIPEETIDPELRHNAIEITGTITQVAKVPALKRTPYRRAVMEVRLVDVEVEAGQREVPGEIVLLGPAVLNRQLTPMAKWRVGQRFRMKIVPWRERSESRSRWHRFALDDPELDLIDAPRYWVEMWGENGGVLMPWVMRP